MASLSQLLPFLFAAFLASAVHGQTEKVPAAAYVASPEPGWPQFRGPRRDGICDEKGLLQAWPEGGPRLLWKTNGLGNGYAAPIITGGRIYITGEADGDLWIRALDLEGRTLWQTKNGPAWNGPYPGARASCTFSDGRLYHLSGQARVACLDAATGQELWAFNMFEQFGGRNLTWATSENLLVDGPRLVLTPGGTKALMAAVDKKTGEPLWATEPLRLGPSPGPSMARLEAPVGEVDNCSYSSPILVQIGSRRLVVNSSLRHVFCVDANSGQLQWTQPLPTRYSVIAATPVLVGNAAYVTAPHTPEGGRLFRLLAEGSQPAGAPLWKTPLDTCHGGAVFVDGSLFGSWYGPRKGWARVDGRTGAVRYETDQLTQGSVLYADERLYCLGQDGEMALLKMGADRFEFAGRFRLTPERKSDVWTHPVILDGRLYLRYQNSLFCYDIRAR